MTTQEPEPLLSEGWTAEWVEVTAELIKAARSAAHSRPSFARAMGRANYIPCEQFCGETRTVGESILLIHFNGEPAQQGKTKRDRYFCSVVCQRQHYFENRSRL
jgi:hypothetical protein